MNNKEIIDKISKMENELVKLKEELNGQKNHQEDGGLNFTINTII